MDKLIRKYALQNAIKFNGKANPGAIIGKLIAEYPSTKKNIDELKSSILTIIKEVNSLSLEQQKTELESSAPELLKKKEKEERNIFAFLKIQKGEKVVTAFPPEPSKYPHIGHAKALLLNYELAKQHKGKFILRFEDTNPTLVTQEFYDIHLENYAWLGIKPDKIEYGSDYMEVFYKAITTLLEKGHAYICSCDQEVMRKNRFDGKICGCRDKKGTLDEFSGMKEGAGVIRLKIDMNHKNSTMRDPAMMRIIDHKHPRLKHRYRAWPTYDFATSILDGEESITHRLRSKEFEMRNELQRYIQKLLGYPETKIFEFARFNLQGVESSGRVIREQIAKKKLLGWDDPSLTTLMALRRRGFVPEAIKQFVMKTGISKAEATLTWDDLIMHNKRILDAKSNRYFFIKNPVKIGISGSPDQIVKLKLHPDYQKRGFRTLKTGQEFCLTKDDWDILKDNKLYRLMDCLNFRKQKEQYVFDSLEHATYKAEGEKIMHWLPVSKDLVKVEVMMQNKDIVKGLAEPGVKKIKEGDVIQFERFGFCRLDDKKKMRFWYTHN